MNDDYEEGIPYMSTHEKLREGLKFAKTLEDVQAVGDLFFELTGLENASYDEVEYENEKQRLF